MLEVASFYSRIPTMVTAPSLRCANTRELHIYKKQLEELDRRVLRNLQQAKLENTTTTPSTDERAPVVRRYGYTMSLNQDQCVYGPIDLGAEIKLGIELYKLAPQSAAMQSNLPHANDFKLTWAGEVHYHQNTFNLTPPGLTEEALQSIIRLYPWVGRVTLTAMPDAGQYQFM